MYGEGLLVNSAWALLLLHITAIKNVSNICLSLCMRVTLYIGGWSVLKASNGTSFRFVRAWSGCLVELDQNVCGSAFSFFLLGAD